MATFSFSLALHFTRELAFGVLAIAGCIVVQCLILAWILFSKAQIRLVLLQAQMLRRMYQQPSEKRHLKDEKKVTNIRVKLPKKEPSPEPELVELSTVHTAPPKETWIPEAPIWQTTALTSRKIGGKRTHAVKHVDVLAPLGIAPPGLGPPDVSRLIALDASPDTAHQDLTDRPVSSLSGDGTDTPKVAHQTVSSLSTTGSLTAEIYANPAAVDSYSGLGASRNNDVEPMTVSEYTGNRPSGLVTINLEGHARVGSLRSFTRRSGVRKVLSAQCEDARTNEHARGDHINDATDTSNFDTTRAIYNSVKPVDYSELQHRFIDTSPLRNASRTERRQFLQAKITPLDPEEAAREALVIASSERELCRVQLNTNYSHQVALDFDEKAKIYSTRRRELAALMPRGTLSIHDEASFPQLSTKDTFEPQMSTVPAGTQEELNVLPSPPTSSDDEDVQPQPREDPGPLIAKASRAFQVLLQATRNMKDECPLCNSRFCEEGYLGTSKLKLKSAKDLYLRSRGSVLSLYGSDELPEGLSQQLPKITEC